MSGELIIFLRVHRKQAGLTQAQLADKISVSRKTINTIENGVFTPSTVLALRLARALDVSVEALFALAEPEDSGNPAAKD